MKPKPAALNSITEIIIYIDIHKKNMKGACLCKTYRLEAKELVEASVFVAIQLSLCSGCCHVVSKVFLVDPISCYFIQFPRLNKH